MAFTKREHKEKRGNFLQLSPQRDHTPLLEGSLPRQHQITKQKALAMDWKDRVTLNSAHLPFDNLHLAY